MASLFRQSWSAFALVAERILARLFQGDERDARKRESGGLENLPALASGARRCGTPFGAVPERKFRFLQQDSAWAAGTQAALETLHGIRRRLSRRSARPGLREEIFQSGSQAAGAENRKRDSSGDGTGHQRSALDVGANQNASARQAACHGQQNRLPRQVARL